jgi:hypothetical protein
MSADNAYFVIHGAGIWSVSHGFMSAWLEQDNPEYRALQVAETGRTYVEALFAKGRKFTNRAEALEFAHDRVNDAAVCEYGVVEGSLDDALASDGTVA